MVGHLMEFKNQPLSLVLAMMGAFLEEWWVRQPD